MHLSNGDNNGNNKPCLIQLSMKWKMPQLVYPYKSGQSKIDYTEKNFPDNDDTITAVKQFITSAGTDFYKHNMQVLVLY